MINNCALYIKTLKCIRKCCCFDETMKNHSRQFCEQSVDDKTNLKNVQCLVGNRKLGNSRIEISAQIDELNTQKSIRSYRWKRINREREGERDEDEWAEDEWYRNQKKIRRNHRCRGTCARDGSPTSIQLNACVRRRQATENVRFFPSSIYAFCESKWNCMKRCMTAQHCVAFAYVRDGTIVVCIVQFIFILCVYVCLGMLMHDARCRFVRSLHRNWEHQPYNLGYSVSLRFASPPLSLTLTLSLLFLQFFCVHTHTQCLSDSP